MTRTTSRGLIRDGATHTHNTLDELTEFRRDAIEGLRQPLEEGAAVVTVVGRVPGTIHAGRGRGPVSVRVRGRPASALLAADPTGVDYVGDTISIKGIGAVSLC